MSSWPIGSALRTTKRTSVPVSTTSSLGTKRLCSTSTTTVTGSGPSASNGGALAGVGQHVAAGRRLAAPATTRPRRASATLIAPHPATCRARAASAATATAAAPRPAAIGHHGVPGAGAAALGSAAGRPTPASVTEGSSAPTATGEVVVEVAGVGVELQVRQPHLRRHPLHADVRAQVVEQRRRRRLAALDGQPGSAGEQLGLDVREQEHVGLDVLARRRDRGRGCAPAPTGRRSGSSP